MARFNALDVRPVARINLTPVIDVGLTLVIALLVTAPMLATLDLGVDLPQARTRARDEAVNLCVTLGHNGELAIGEELVAPAAFVASLRQELAVLAQAGKTDVLVVIRADAGAPHVAVRGLLASAREAGAARIGIATRQREARP